MKSALKKIVFKLFPKQALRIKAYRNLIKNQNSYLYLTGWVQSLGAGKPLDKDGKLLPWMNYPVIRILEDRLTSEMDLFEYGSGYSTIFYADRVKNVDSIEYDQDWFQRMQSQAPGNANLIFKAHDVDGEYCRAISTTGKAYHVVVVDGRDRVNCVKQSIASLAESGVLLLDDSQRERYREALTHMESSGFRALSIEGMKPTGNEIYRTTIFYRDGNCLGI